jgi:hypothetical protein
MLVLVHCQQLPAVLTAFHVECTSHPLGSLLKPPLTAPIHLWKSKAYCCCLWGMRTPCPVYLPSPRAPCPISHKRSYQQTTVGYSLLLLPTHMLMSMQCQHMLCVDSRHCAIDSLSDV